MTTPSASLFEKLDTAHATARARVMDAISGAADRDEDRLIRWMITKDISPYEVFIDWPTESFTSYEGIDNLLGLFGHAFRDDGDVTFFATDRSSPKIVFLPRDEVAAFVREQTADHIYFGEDDEATHKSLEVTEILNDVDAYIATFTQYQAEYEADFKEFWEDDLSPDV